MTEFMRVVHFTALVIICHAYKKLKPLARSTLKHVSDAVHSGLGKERLKYGMAELKEVLTSIALVIFSHPDPFGSRHGLMPACVDSIIS